MTSPVRSWSLASGLLTPLSVSLVFLATAGLLLWDPLGRAALLPPPEPAHPETILPVPVRHSAGPTAYRGSENCKECHSKRKYRKLWHDWTKGGHSKVSCEACHGPAGDHGVADIDPRPEMPVPLAALAEPHALCMSCHAKTPRRQASLPQIEPQKHLLDFKVKPGDPEYEQAFQCLTCHNPHRPVKR